MQTSMRVLKSGGPLAAKLGPSRLFVIDGISPEDVAMLQALYSRSASSVEKHLEKLADAGSGRFMERFYVGYNHKSIADCGSTTMFIENVSMLCAKAIEDWPLYSGQETSTRFIDMAKQPLVDPVGTDQSKAVLARLMAFYSAHQERVSDEVRKRHPRFPIEPEDVYERAVKARTFDIMRGFLPAGICTQLSWHTNLRQAGDHLSLMLKHPAAEIQRVAKGLAQLLSELYPSSIGIGEQAAVSAVVGGGDARAAWEAEMMREYAYHFKARDPHDDSNGSSFWSTVDRVRLEGYSRLLKTRPRGAMLPHFLSDLGQLHFHRFTLDFGSFRDLQRHRNGVCRMPLLTVKYGFEPWYLDQLDDELRGKAEDLLTAAAFEIESLTEDPVERQYYVPMGFGVPCDVTYGLPAAVYVAELRTNKTVHPTLRKVTQWMASCIGINFKDVVLHTDLEADDWSIRRGNQTIEEKTRRG